MRKNKGDRKGLKELYTVYQITGLNLDRLIEVSKNRGITLHDVKKKSNKVVQITVNFKDKQKFFAISKELCYNIKKVKDKGRDYPFYSLFKSFGLLLGGIVFILSAIFTNDLIFSFSFVGSGSLYKSEVKEYLDEIGIRELSRFSNIDLERLEDKIVSSLGHFSFASCKKQGNVLVVELVLEKNSVGKLNGKEYSLVCDQDGVIEEIKVYRGTAVVKKGDQVKKGDLLVDGFEAVQGTQVKVNVLASITVICTAEYQYVSDKDHQEEIAFLYAEQQTDGLDVLSRTAKKERQGKEYVYKVITKFRRVITAG